MSLGQSKFYKTWKTKQMEILTRTFPDKSVEVLSEIVDREAEKQFVNPKATLHNNYTGQTKSTTLLAMTDWIDEKKPIVAGFGVLFKNQHQEINPNATMLLKMLALRKQFKGEAFMALNKMEELSKLTNMHAAYDAMKEEYANKDRMQGTEKGNINSQYGALGCPTSKLYNLYTAQAVTASGQLEISTTNSAFEYFGTNSNPYLNFNECATFIRNVIVQDMPNIKVLPVVGFEKAFDKLKSNFHVWDDAYQEPLELMLKGLSEEDYSKLYYKNNIYDFVRIPEMKEMFLDIFRKMDTFNDPNKVPSEIKAELEAFNKLVNELVVYNHIAFDRRYRLKNMERHTVTTIDTDSNMPYVGNWVKFSILEILQPAGVVDNSNYENMLYGTVNIMAYMMTDMIAEILKVYCQHANIPEDYWIHLRMKNEFLFSIMYLSNVKKRYITEVLLREGNVVSPRDVDVKGHDFKKSSTSEESKKFFEGLIHKYLMPKGDDKIESLLNDNIDVTGLVKELNTFGQDIISSIRNGEKKYLTPMKVKEFQAYKDIYRIRQAMAAMYWNMAYPDQELELPDTVMVAQVDLNTEEKLRRIEKYDPDAYDRLYKAIYLNGTPEIRKKGLYVIAIPGTVKDIPQWITDNTEAEVISNKLVSKFHSVLHALGTHITKAGGQNYLTNIVTL